MQSSVRELRMTAGSTIVAYLRPEDDPKICSDNRRMVLSRLKSLSEKRETSEQESLIYAWGQAARSCGDNELYLALVELVRYLGHPNNYICAVAYLELLRLSEYRKCSLEVLFRPFWRTVARVVVDELETNPQKIQQLSDLLGVKVETFLAQTNLETVPWLALTRRREVLRRIAIARGHDKGIQDVLTQPPINFAATLSIFLLQDGTAEEIERNTVSALCDLCAHFRGVTISGLLKGHELFTSCEMLKEAGDQPLGRKSHVSL